MAMDEEQVKLLQGLIVAFEKLNKSSGNVLEYRHWADMVDSLMFDRKIPLIDGAYRAHLFLSGFIGQTDREGFRDARRAAMKIYNGLREQLAREDATQRAQDSSDGTTCMPSEEGDRDVSTRKVFIVHGHDEAKKWELKDFILRLDLEPIVLHEQDDRGMTIIEKFEHYASECEFAFVLLTPDDPAAHAASTEAKWRARQNVIMELGWFMAKLGRERVAILHKGAVEIPSDILGVVYLPFVDSVLEVAEKIRQRLKGVRLLN
jgi:predicted nucleotide-binding protein